MCLALAASSKKQSLKKEKASSPKRIKSDTKRIKSGKTVPEKDQI